MLRTPVLGISFCPFLCFLRSKADFRHSPLFLSNAFFMQGLFLGLTTLDIQYLVNSFPKENGKQKSENFLLNIGGPALNAAATFVKLGGEAIFFTVIGNHTLSDFVKSQCKKLGIQAIDLAPEFPELPIIASIVSNSQTGDRSILRNKGITPDPDLGLLSHALDFFSTHELEIMLLDGFHMPAALYLAKYGHAAGIPVVFDGGSWKEGCEELLDFVDIAICSHDFKTPQSSVMEYLTQKKVSARAITRGEKPILFQQDTQTGEIPVPQVKAIDTLGAGDVFHGAFCYYKSRGEGFQRSLSLASEVAAASTTRFGVH